VRRLAVVLMLLMIAPARADEPAPAEEVPAEPVVAKKKKKKKARHAISEDKGGKLDKDEDTVAGGKHWRIKTSKGAIHVWIPRGYDRDTAGVVVYIHGYYIDSDGAWKDHDLAAQFKASKQNAMFIVPDAPSGKDESVFWPALTDLRKAVRRANIRLPSGPTVVMGHSGAFRTIRTWIDHKAVTQVILLDALYGGEAAFDEFIGTGKRAKQHKMIVVGEDTGMKSKEFAKKYAFALVRDQLPEATSGFTKKEKKAKLLYVRSQYGHMEMVTNGKVIPMLLRLTPLKKL